MAEEILLVPLTDIDQIEVDCQDCGFQVVLSLEKEIPRDIGGRERSDSEFQHCWEQSAKLHSALVSLRDLRSQTGDGKSPSFVFRLKRSALRSVTSTSQ